MAQSGFLSRRTLLQAAVLSPALKAAAHLSPQSAASQGTTLPQPSLSPVSYSQVELLPGPLRQQFDTNHRFFFNLNEDRMLKIYRQRAGLPAPGPNMGGWYDDFCPGASFGQYVSALARYAATTGSQPTREKVQRLVRGYAATVAHTDKFFVDLRYPAYTYDKLVLMLIDAHSYASDDSAFDVLARTTQAALPHMPERAVTGEELQERPHKDATYTWDESYTLAENLFLAFDRTGNKRYFDLGKRYLLDRSFFDPLSEGKNVLPGLHAYSHMNALSSGMQGYLKLGDPKYLRAVTNAMDMILKEQSYATGGWGPNEGFVEPGKGALGKSLDETHRSFETPCGSYAHFKVCRYLMALTRNSQYGDSMERLLYNALLGVKPILEDGSSFYYSDYHQLGHKTYRRVIPGAKWAWDLDDKWPCCSGTLPQVVADYGISSYFRGPDGIYINLYVPSRVQWMHGGTRCSLSQQTSYPYDNLVSLTMTPSSPTDMALHLRIPAWAGRGTSVAVNGSRLREELVPGTFFAIQRHWKAGDRVELQIDQTVRQEAIDPSTTNRVALLRGPQVLFAVTDKPVQLRHQEIASLQLANHGDGWTAQPRKEKLDLRPFGAIRNEKYQTYMDVIG